MWYLWKARNNTRFQRKIWNPWQVHHAVEAHINTHRAALQNQHTDNDSTHQESHTPLQGMHPLPTGHTTASHTANEQLQQTRDTTSAGMQIYNTGTDAPSLHLTQTAGDPSENRYLVRFLDSLQGVRCYTDASTSPDLPSSNPRIAGIGLFIINTQVQPAQTIYIKATMTTTTSVLMGEAAAIALAAVVTHRLGFQQVTFLSYNQQLVHFLNGQIKLIHRSGESNTSLKPSSTSQPKEIKNLTHNQTADVLTRQALVQSQSHVSSGLLCTCSNAVHGQCTPLEALYSVALNSVRLLTAACCS
jgi:hypothetical protein